MCFCLDLSHTSLEIHYKMQNNYFFVKLILMTKYFVLKECGENILTSGYLCVMTTVFSQQKGISIFKFPKWFSEISCRDLTSFLFFSLV